MEYLVLARKWRPQSFEDVVGQDHIVQTLRNAIGHNRIAHALLFGGPRGVGKTSVARIMAKAVNCETGPTETPCNQCHNCREITEGISIDVREIDGASNRGIDEIRELREYLKFAPVSSRYKIYIIDEVHMLTREAFNALLKTLEEPPAHVLFIFATTEVHKVPATILSRCQRYDFRRVSLRQIAESLRRIADAEKIQVSDKGLKWIAAAGDGSMRDAQSIFDQVISYAGYEIADGAVEEILGLTDKQFFLSMSAAVFERDAGACLKIIDRAYFAGIDMKVFYQTLLAHFRNLFLVKIIGADCEVLELTADELAELSAQTDRVSKETLQRLLDILMAEDEPIRRSANPRLNLETTLVRMAHLPPLIPIDAILTRMEELEKRLAAGGERPGRKKEKVDETAPPAAYRSENPVPATAFQAPEEKPATGFHEVREDRSQDQLWRDMQTFIKEQNPLLSTKIEKGKFLACEDGAVEIGFPGDYIFLDDIREKDQKDRLAELVAAFFGKEMAVRITAIDPPPEVKNGQGDKKVSKANGIQEVKREALSHPMLQKVLDVFGSAEVREVIARKNQGE
jgi:DNA polymerase III subunit gamma/tau